MHLRAQLRALGTSVAAAALVAACGSSTPAAVYRTATTGKPCFGDYRTMAFVGQRDVPGFHRAELPSAMAEAAIAAGRQTLEARGYQAAPVDEADLLFRAGVGRRVRIERVAYPSPEWQCPVAVDCYEQQVDEGTVVIDAYDRESGAHVWQGQVTGEVPRDLDRDALAEAVRRLLAEFPRGGTEGGGEASDAGGEASDVGGEAPPDGEVPDAVDEDPVGP
ncbi:MAG: DUF4136 domain-containing protein [Sandaracinaceae bacterium]